MTDIPLGPLKFEPIFQYRLWGGRALGEWMHTALPGGDPIGEAWVLSDRAEQASRVCDGAMRGRTLPDLMRDDKAAILGRWADRFDRFPLLLKFLDVEKMLSVQVHPRDDQTDLIPAGDTGKTEAWVVLAARSGSRIYAGLQPKTKVRDLRVLDTHSAADCLASFAPQVGQGVLIEAGTVHALGDGVVVFEVQENSDVTFRLYDWDHVDARTGKPRALQVEQALACIDLDRGPILPVTPLRMADQSVRRERLFDNAHFRLERASGDRPFVVGAPDEPRVLVCVDGQGRIDGEGSVSMEQGAVALLPASVGARLFRPDGAATLLEIAIGETR
jgi:mannose-6-phosphate isomerase